jgi:GAF domain-containing protein
METSSAIRLHLPAEPVEVPPLAELGTLYDISEALASARTLHEGLGDAMQLLRRYPGALRGSLTLLDEETSELYIEAGPLSAG